MIALLPMKERSERVPGKNIKNLNGKPLFYHIADTLKESGLFKWLVINTDSEEVSRLASEYYGDWVHIIRRPPGLCGDNVPMNLIIEHDVNHLGINNDYFQTHSTNPFLSVATVKAAVSQYQSGKKNGEFDSVFSVNALHTRLYDKRLMPLNHDPDMLIRTQDLEVIYEENSNFYIFSGDSYSHRKHRIGEVPSPYVMSRNSIEGVDIDELSDWDFAELVIKSGYKND
jgi:CMP-N-acetylneuraminic acid synthetase